MENFHKVALCPRPQKENGYATSERIITGIVRTPRYKHTCFQRNAYLSAPFLHVVSSLLRVAFDAHVATQKLLTAPDC